MRINVRLRDVLLEIICLLYIMLFTYAAVSKLLDMENFTVQIAQSPLLSPFAQWVAPSVPVAELSITFLISMPKLRLFVQVFGLTPANTRVIFSVLLLLVSKPGRPIGNK